MSDRQAFRPQGNTVEIDVTNASSTPVQIQAPGPGPISEQVRIANAGAGNVYIAFGDASSGSSGATIVAAIPTSGNPANGVLMLANTVEIFSYNPQGYIAAICGGADTAKLYITPGEGL